MYARRSAGYVAHTQRADCRLRVRRTSENGTQLGRLRSSGSGGGGVSRVLDCAHSRLARAQMSRISPQRCYSSWRPELHVKSNYSTRLVSCALDAPSLARSEPIDPEQGPHSPPPDLVPTQPPCIRFFDLRPEAYLDPYRWLCRYRRRAEAARTQPGRPYYHPPNSVLYAQHVADHITSSYAGVYIQNATMVASGGKQLPFAQQYAASAIAACTAEVSSATPAVRRRSC